MRRSSIRPRGAAALLAALAAAVAPSLPAAAQSIGIDWGNQEAGAPGGTVGALAPSTTAGVVAQSNWNSFVVASQSTPQSLVNNSGAATGAAVTWSSNNTWANGISQTPGNFQMMAGYLDTSDSSVTTVSVTGIPFAAYDVYVYADGDATGGRAGLYNIGGADNGSGGFTGGITQTIRDEGTFSGSFVQAVAGNSFTGNYVVFSGLSGASLTLRARADVGGTRGPLNGIQIVAASTTAVPEAGTLAFAAVPALLGAVAVSRRRRRRAG